MADKSFQIAITKSEKFEQLKLLSPLPRPHLAAVAGRIKKVVFGEVRAQSYYRAYLKKDPTSLGLHLCDDEEIRQINCTFRKVDRATDVLSFPTFEMWGQAEIASSPKAISLGDIVMSLPTIERAAYRLDRSVAEEFLEVFIHGVLHLWGYDHIRRPGIGAREVARMRQLQADLYAQERVGIKKHL